MFSKAFKGLAKNWDQFIYIWFSEYKSSRPMDDSPQVISPHLIVMSPQLPCHLAPLTLVSPPYEFSSKFHLKLWIYQLQSVLKCFFLQWNRSWSRVIRFYIFIFKRKQFDSICYVVGPVVGSSALYDKTLSCFEIRLVRYHRKQGKSLFQESWCCQLSSIAVQTFANKQSK